jgi:hypothetical protein
MKEKQERMNTQTEDAMTARPGAAWLTIGPWRDEQLRGARCRLLGADTGSVEGTVGRVL